jgi:IS30 family transposase
LVRQPELLQYVTDHLAMGWSPQLISGRLARLQIGLSISHESIYRYIYYRRELKDYLYRLLPQARSRRRKHGSKLPFCARIPARKPIAERPSHVETRKEAGHWEADMMLFSKPAHGLVVLCERRSRYLTLRRVKGRKADTICTALLKDFATVPPHLRQSCTFDNGVEFWRHLSLVKAYGLATWFCDPYAPWQKGSVENAIGRLRRRLPRHTNLDQVKPKTLKEITNAYNNTPRICLDFQTPNEVYSKQTVALRT